MGTLPVFFNYSFGLMLKMLKCQVFMIFIMNEWVINCHNLNGLFGSYGP